MNWIPIYMKLPEEGEYVLVTDGKEIYIACYYYTPFTPHAFEWVDKKDQIISDRVILWSHLPDLPKG